MRTCLGLTIAFFILLAIIFFMDSCSRPVPERKADSSASKSPEIDSIKPAPDPLLKITRYLEKMSKCRDLENKRSETEIRYINGTATEAEYNKACRIYKNYYFTVYKPALDSLKK